MPEFDAAPFPPMPVLRGAVPGWPPDDPLTSVNTPDGARMALRAQSDTSVLDPRGLRRLWLGPARWRWYRQLRREPVVVPPPAAWPAGSEAYAVLSGVASVESVAPSWLHERLGLSPTVGAQWVDVLTRQGWTSGGGRLLGLARLPEEHVRVTDAGRERLERERARLQALAAP
jgi:hypothetical protein